MQEEAPLVMVRLRVVKLLGHLGGKLNRNLVTGKNSHPIYSFYFTMGFLCLVNAPEKKVHSSVLAFSDLIRGNDEEICCLGH